MLPRGRLRHVLGLSPNVSRFASKNLAEPFVARCAFVSLSRGLPLVSASLFGFVFHRVSCPRLLRLCCRLQVGGRQARSPSRRFNPTFRGTLIVLGLPLLCGRRETFTGHASKPFSLDDSPSHPAGSTVVTAVSAVERPGGVPVLRLGAAARTRSQT
jgi:hypothetical protein